MDETLEQLIDRARNWAMTTPEVEEQRINFAYGNSPEEHTGTLESMKETAGKIRTGQVIDEALKRLGKTQSWLAEQMDVSNNAVSKWIRLGGGFSTRRVRKLASLLEVDIGLLLSEGPERVARLAALIEKEGGVPELLRKIEERGGEAPNKSYLYQILGGHCVFGENAARNLAKQLGLPTGYFGHDDVSDDFYKESASMYRKLWKASDERVLALEMENKALKHDLERLYAAFTAEMNAPRAEKNFFAVKLGSIK